MYVIGKILKPHGIRGQVKAEIVTSFPEHFQELDTVYIEKDNQRRTYSIESVRLSDRFVIVKLNDVDSLEAAETLRGGLICIQEKDLTPLSEGEYYIHDLIGLHVYDEQDNFWGTIVKFESYPANDVLIMRDRKEKDQMIPAIKDVILSVDTDAGKMIIRPIEGLLE